MTESIAELRVICQTVKAVEMTGNSLGALQERYFYRRLSIYITRLFLALGLTPNQVTLMSGLASIAGGIFLMSPAAWSWVVGGAFVYLYELLDRVDGELARYRNSSSVVGEYWDGVVGTFTWHFIYAGAAIGVYNTFNDVRALFFGLAAVLFYHMLDWLNADLRRNLAEKGISSRQPDRDKGYGRRSLSGIAAGILSFGLAFVKLAIPLVGLVDMIISPLTVGTFQFDARYIYLMLVATVVVAAATGRVFFEASRLRRV